MPNEIKPEMVPDEVLRAFIAAYHDKRMLLSVAIAAALEGEP